MEFTGRAAESWQGLCLLVSIFFVHIGDRVLQ